MPIYNVCHVCEVIEYNICHVYEVIKYDVCHVCGADVYNALIFKVHSTATNIDLKNFDNNYEQLHRSSHPFTYIKLLKTWNN